MAGVLVSSTATCAVGTAYAITSLAPVCVNGLLGSQPSMLALDVVRGHALKGTREFAQILGFVKTPVESLFVIVQLVSAVTTVSLSVLATMLVAFAVIVGCARMWVPVAALQGRQEQSVSRNAQDSCQMASHVLGMVPVQRQLLNVSAKMLGVEPTALSVAPMNHGISLAVVVVCAIQMHNVPATGVSWEPRVVSSVPGEVSILAVVMACVKLAETVIVTLHGQDHCATFDVLVARVIHVTVTEHASLMALVFVLLIYPDCTNPSLE